MSKIAIVVPEYNEPDLEERLGFFDELGRALSGTADVIIVDDASTNGNRELLVDYVTSRNPAFSVHFMEKNGQKVGAIKSTVKALPEEVDTVFLSDIDSSYVNTTPEDINGIREDLQTSQGVVGGTLRMKPAYRKGILNRLQTTEYEFLRSVMRFLQKEGKNFCLPGPSAVYKRDVLEELLEEHSGRHNGDDRELAVLAMKRGGLLKYWDHIDVETTAPSTLNGLFKQRVRYALGSLETISKEPGFYFRNALTAFKGKRFGLITAFELYGTATLPVGAYALIRAMGDDSLEILGRYWAADSAFTSAWLFYGRKEIENKVATALTIPFVPAYRLGVMLPTRLFGQAKFLGQAVDNALLRLHIKQADVYERVATATQTLENNVKKVAATVVTSLSNQAK